VGLAVGLEDGAIGDLCEVFECALEGNTPRKALHIRDDAEEVAIGLVHAALAIGAETLSRYLNMKDRGSCILFGDGAGAAVVTPWADCERGEILETTLGADGSGFEFIHIPVGGAAIPHNHPKYVKDDHFITLRGRDVYRFAVTKMAEMIETVTRNVDPDDVAWVVPHQVNKRIIDAALSRVGWSIDRCVVNIDRFGNTSAASVPIALDEAVRDGRIKKGQLVVLVAFGAGLTWGGTLLRW